MTQKTDRQICRNGSTNRPAQRKWRTNFSRPLGKHAPLALAVALNEQDLYEWREFSAELAATIAATEQNNDPSSYYARWVASLKELVIARGLISREQLDARTAEYAAGIHDDHDH